MKMAPSGSKGSFKDELSRKGEVVLIGFVVNFLRRSCGYYNTLMSYLHGKRGKRHKHSHTVHICIVHKPYVNY